MTDRLTASTINDAQLDELYARAEQAEAMLGRVAVLGSDLFTAGTPGPERETGRKILNALSLPRTAPAATEPATCCVCGGGPVVYRNYREQPFCWPCADCGCNQDLCVRTGINDPVVSVHGARDLTPDAAEALNALVTVAKQQITEPGPDCSQATPNNPTEQREQPPPCPKDCGATSQCPLHAQQPDTEETGV